MRGSAAAMPAMDAQRACDGATASTYVRYLSDGLKKSTRKACVPVALQHCFRVLYELEKTSICKHCFRVSESRKTSGKAARKTARGTSARADAHRTQNSAHDVSKNTAQHVTQDVT
jgi:hypothetical protein